MLRKAVFSILILSYYLPCLLRAQSDPIIIPFRTVGNLLIVSGEVNGRPGDLMLDTGISKMLLDQADAQGQGQFTNKEFSGLQSINGAGFNAGMNLVSLQIGDFFAKVGAAIANLQSIERQKGIDLLGVVGIDLFRKYEIEIDPFAQEIRLYHLDGEGVRLVQEPRAFPSATLAFRNQGHLLCITAKLNGEPLQLGLDTGAERIVFVHEVYENSPGQFSHERPKRVLGVNGRQTTGSVSQVSGLEIGGLPAPAAGVLILSANTYYGGLDGRSVHGLLGFPFFQQYRTAINFRKREVYLWDRPAAEQAPVVRN